MVMIWIIEYYVLLFGFLLYWLYYAQSYNERHPPKTEGEMNVEEYLVNDPEVKDDE